MSISFNKIDNLSIDKKNSSNQKSLKDLIYLNKNKDKSEFTTLSPAKIKNKFSTKTSVISGSFFIPKPSQIPIKELDYTKYSIQNKTSVLSIMRKEVSKRTKALSINFNSIKIPNKLTKQKNSNKSSVVNLQTELETNSDNKDKIKSALFKTQITTDANKIQGLVKSNNNLKHIIKSTTLKDDLNLSKLENLVQTKRKTIHHLKHQESLIKHETNEGESLNSEIKLKSLKKTSSNLISYQYKNLDDFFKKSFDYNDYETSMSYLNTKMSHGNIKNNKKNINYNKKTHPLVDHFENMLMNIPSLHNSIYLQTLRKDKLRKHSISRKNENYEFSSALKNKKRWKTYEVQFIENYFANKYITETTFTISLTEDSDFQNKLISEELSLIAETIYSLKYMFLSDKEINLIFNTFNHRTQIILNSSLEEIIGLLLVISQMILMEFHLYLDKFIISNPPNPDKLSSYYVNNEPEVFNNNNKLFNEVITYFKNCKNVYFILIKNVNDIVLKAPDYKKLNQYFTRCRMKCSELLYLFESSISNFIEDKKILDYTIKDKDNYNPIKDKLSYSLNKNNSLLRARDKKINEVLPKKNNKKLNSEEKRKLGGSSSKEYISVINSKALFNLTNFVDPEIKKQILSMRVADRYETLLYDQN